MVPAKWEMSDRWLFVAGLAPYGARPSAEIALSIETETPFLQMFLFFYNLDKHFGD